MSELDSILDDYWDDIREGAVPITSIMVKHKRRFKDLAKEILKDPTVEMSDQTYTYLLRRFDEL